jgi:hypothetical protein
MSSADGGAARHERNAHSLELVSLQTRAALAVLALARSLPGVRLGLNVTLVIAATGALLDHGRPVSTRR